MALRSSSCTSCIPVSVSRRELGLFSPEAFAHRCQFTEASARKLTIETVLHGHSGCVNRLAWNHDGSLLASGSDDRQIILWHYPDVGRAPLGLRTQHRANIFGVQFLPCSGNRRIVSCAMDHTVQLHEIDAGASAGGGAAAAAAAVSSPQTQRHARSPSSWAGNHTTSSAPVLRMTTPRTFVHRCHNSRVKEVKVEPMNPHNYWSASEDGYVRQFDTRCSNQNTFESPNALIAVRERGSMKELKSLDINKAHPQYMAVAASDSQLRVYDRRKLQTFAPASRSGSGGTGCQPVLRLVPPHLALGRTATSGRANSAHVTHCNFSNHGDRIIATYHGDQAYSFDVTSVGSVHAAYPCPPAQSPSQPSRSVAEATEHGNTTGTRSDSSGALYDACSPQAKQRCLLDGSGNR